MTLDEYELLIFETSIYPEQYKIIYPALGLAGETGETCEKIKKVIRDGNGIQELKNDLIKRSQILKECGDVLWYLSALSRDMGSSLSEIMQINFDKLKNRAERGVLHGNGDER